MPEGECGALKGSAFRVASLFEAQERNVSFVRNSWWSVALLAFLVGGCASRHALDSTSTASVPEDVTQTETANNTDVQDPAPAPATLPDGSVTFETAVQRAVSWHPSVTEASSRLRQQEAAVRQAEAGYLPTIGWGIDSSYKSDPQGGYQPLLNLTGSQMIYDFGKVSGEVDVAEAGVEQGRTRILSAIDTLARDTGRAVIEVKRAEALRSIAKDQLDDTTDILELVRARTKSGANTRSDQLQAESRVDAAKSTLLEVQDQFSRSQAILGSFLGMEDAVDVDGAFPSWLNEACSKRKPDWAKIPAIMEARAEQAAAKAQLGLSRAKALPTLSLDGRIGSDITALGDEEPEYRIGLNVSGDLYNGNESAARREAANYALSASKAKVKSARVEVSRNLLEASRQASSLRKLEVSIGKRIEKMRETRELYETQYIELGTRTLLDLLNAAQELHAARLRRRNIQYDIHTLSLDCLFSLGNIRQAFSLNGRISQLTASP